MAQVTLRSVTFVGGQLSITADVDGVSVTLAFVGVRTPQDVLAACKTLGPSTLRDQTQLAALQALVNVVQTV